MNQINHKYCRFILVSLLMLFIPFYKLTAQNIVSKSDINPEDIFRVEWVKSWPSKDSKKNSRRFEDKLNSFLFGIKTPELRNPVSVLATNPDNFLILDQGNQTLLQIHKGVGDIPHQILKSGFDFSSLVGICYGPNSSIYFTDSKSQKIYRFSTGEKKLYIQNDSLLLEQPTGIAFSKFKKEIWVVETKAHRISVLDDKGKLIKRVGTRGTSPGQFNYPTHISIDKKGNIYIVDSMNFRIQVFNPEGKVISVFGEAGDATGFMARPKGIATDSFGNIYIADALFHAIQVFDLKGKFLYSFGNQGHGNGEFWMPNGIFIDDQNNIYVADTYNSRIQIFQLIHKDIK